MGSSKSPVRRSNDKTKGRQVDCIAGARAYEFKIRVTIAASGQGRWAEELDFPVDCSNSGYTPVLVVLDPTPNPKLSELSEAFENAGGEVYIGGEAWQHLDGKAGSTMATFLQKYVRTPIAELLDHTPDVLPEITLRMTTDSITLAVDGDKLHIDRT